MGAAWWGLKPIGRSENEDGPYPVCGSCLHRQSDACDDCVNADEFVLDEELVEQFYRSAA